MYTRDPLNLVGRACAAAILLALLNPSGARAGVVFGAGGGIATRVSEAGTLGPAASMTLRVPMTSEWSLTSRAGVERFDDLNALPIVLPNAFYVGFPTHAGPGLLRRETYVSVGVGARYSMVRPSPARARAFVAYEASLTWAHLEQRVANDLGIIRAPLPGDESTSQWLPGANVVVGLQHPLSESVAFEWGILFAARQAPHGRDVARLGFADHGASTVGLSAAVTVAR